MLPPNVTAWPIFGSFNLQKKPLNQQDSGARILTAWERLRTGETSKSLHFPHNAESVDAKPVSKRNSG
jgi:hypothetical protein